jgi:hypothetical protein
VVAGEFVDADVVEYKVITADICGCATWYTVNVVPVAVNTSLCSPDTTYPSTPESPAIRAGYTAVEAVADGAIRKSIDSVSRQ